MDSIEYDLASGKMSGLSLGIKAVRIPRPEGIGHWRFAEDGAGNLTISWVIAVEISEKSSISV